MTLNLGRNFFDDISALEIAATSQHYQVPGHTKVVRPVDDSDRTSHTSYTSSGGDECGGTGDGVEGRGLRFGLSPRQGQDISQQRE